MADPPTPTRQPRNSARVIVLDEAGRVLLFCVVDPTSGQGPLWMTPGGRVEPHETVALTAVRELREETGLDVDTGQLEGPVARCRGEWEFRGVSYRGEDVFFALRTQHYEPDDAHWSDLERELHQSWRWCEAEELDGLEGSVLPLGLGELINQIRAARPFSQPVTLPWSAG